MYHSISEFPPDNFLDEEEKLSEHKTRFKGYGDGRGGNGAKVFAYLLHF